MAQTNTAAANGTRKFGLLDKVSYAAGDFGCNMSFALKGTLTIYWTQFMGINQVLMAGLLLVQVWDAINDPLIGSMVDGARCSTTSATSSWRMSRPAAWPDRGRRPVLPALPGPAGSGRGHHVRGRLYRTPSTPWPTCLNRSPLSLITDDPIEVSQLSTWRRRDDRQHRHLHPAAHAHL